MIPKCAMTSCKDPGSVRGEFRGKGKVTGQRGHDPIRLRMWLCDAHAGALAHFGVFSAFVDEKDIDIDLDWE